MKQLTMGTLLQLVKELKESGMSAKEISNLKIYIGDDDELNGIHSAWYSQLLDPNDAEDEGFVDLINENHNNNKLLNEKAILIS